MTSRALRYMARVYYRRLRTACSLVDVPYYFMVCELLDAKEVKRAKTLTSGRANGARETGVTPENPAVRSSLLGRFPFVLPCGTVFAGLP